MIETGYGGNDYVPTSEKNIKYHLCIYLFIRLVDVWENYRYLF